MIDVKKLSRGKPDQSLTKMITSSTHTFNLHYFNTGFILTGSTATVEGIIAKRKKKGGGGRGINQKN